MSKIQNSITLDDLYKKLDILIALIAIKDNNDDIDKVKILRDLDYSIKDISKYLGLSSRTIDNYIATLKKSKRK